MAKTLDKQIPVATLNRHDLDIFQFSSSDDARPVLQQILIRKTEGYTELVVTDSYRAVLYKSQLTTLEFEPFMVPRDVFKRLIKLVGTRKVKGTNRPNRANMKAYTIKDSVELYPDRAEIPTLGVTMTFEQMDGKFPDIDKLIKDKIVRKDYAAPINLNPAYVGDLVKFVGADYMGGQSVTFRHNGVMEPFEIFKGNTYAVLMPLKS